MARGIACVLDVVVSLAAASSTATACPCQQVECRKVGAGGRCTGGCHVTKSCLPGR